MTLNDVEVYIKKTWQLDFTPSLISPLNPHLIHQVSSLPIREVDSEVAW